MLHASLTNTGKTKGDWRAACLGYFVTEGSSLAGRSSVSRAWEPSYISIPGARYKFLDQVMCLDRRAMWALRRSGRTGISMEVVTHRRRYWGR